MDALVTAPAISNRVRPLLARYRGFLLYAAIGGGAVAVDVAIYAALAVPVGLHPVFANTVSTFVGVCFSFAANSLLNFKVTDRIVARFLSFALVSGAGYLVSTLMLAVLVDGLGIDGLVAKAATLPVVLALQYTLNKRTTFASAKGRTAS